jgi:hypothetical protein
MLALTWDDEADLRAAVAQGPFDLILGSDSLFVFNSFNKSCPSIS